MKPPKREDYPRNSEDARSPLSREQHVAMLMAAIRANLDARLEHDRRCERRMRRQSAAVSGDAVSAADILAIDRDWLRLDGLIHDPLRQALRKQLKELGQQLYELVKSIAVMQDIAYDVAGRGRAGSHRLAIIDKNWDGIGSGNDRWWA